MRPVLQPSVNRRHLLTFGARLSIATLTSAAIWPHSGASQSGLVEGYAEGDGVRLYFVQGGEGQLMLFLHGAPDNWEAVEAYGMPRLLGDVHALLRYFRRERCILVGNDWGGYIAWVFASAYPGRVERLII